MKKVTLVLLTACLIWTVQTVKAQTPDTTKNNIEVKKKVKQGVHGRTVTKVKMTGKGTPEALKESANGTATGHLAPPKPAVEPVVVTPPPATPAVVVVHDTVHQTAPAPAPKTTTTRVTTTTETRPVVTKTTTTHHVVATKKTYHKPVHTYHKTYSKTAVGAPTTKTVTTTTVQKTQ
ncbi:hypothetical protein C8P68_11186 [Mucilaginibacter yixingensis]|uniref:Uncharacterized protein n=1 Tax=Mucilaginibacter yixingensis TaxID=1295612 RepID=A0A2T5J4X4_9SPHI|nr:hypothetical protein [Mucilaginibacter yixingensis]PTQ92709.1 hypothetical protein C8P68_11186 [Mucilaginibacter yixingensis]